MEAPRREAQVRKAVGNGAICGADALSMSMGVCKGTCGDDEACVVGERGREKAPGAGSARRLEGETHQGV